MKTMKNLLTGNRSKKRKVYHYRCTNFLLDDGCALYVEDYFHEMIYMERKRSERSGSHFVLMLMDIGKLFDEKRAAELVKKTADSLSSSTRETDIKGWYRHNSVIGVIFTGTDHSRITRIHEKVTSGLALAGIMGAGLHEKIDISFHVFPEGHDGERRKINFDLKLYPDLVKKDTALKFSIALKRLMDIGGSIFGLALFSPFFITIAGIIKLTSRGPVFFRQERAGGYGMPFVFLKFRSMYAGNDERIHTEYVRKLIREQRAYGSEAGETIYKIKNDPRVTPLGRLIRKTSLDELPQFINVLKGDMSLVGPRPPIPYELEDYEPWHRLRIREMKPGITGVWQVKGRSRTTFNEMVRMDIGYSKTWSLWLDLKLLLQTPWSMLMSKGAY